MGAERESFRTPIRKGGGESQITGDRCANAGDQHSAANIRQKIAT